jgi:hypothetical protein
MVVSMMSVMAISASAAGEVAEIVTVGEGGTGAVGDQFATVNEAVAAAGEGGEVKLIADIYIAAGELNVGIDGDYTTTLNLNGHNITNEAGSCITLYSKYPGGKTFTIKGSGTVTCTPKYTGDACISDSSGRNVVIKGGTYTNTVAGKNALYVSSDQGWTISGGTFNGNIMVKSDLTMTAGTVNGNIIQDGKPDYTTPYPWTNIPSDITISGGTVNGEIVENADNNGNIVVTGGTFAGDASEYVDMTDVVWVYTTTQGKTQYLKTSPSAYASGTYKLMKDITTTSYITPSTFGSNLTIDLNGHTYTSSASRGYAVLLGRNGTATSPNKFTLKNGTIVYTNASSEYAAVQAQGKYNDIVIDNVTITSAVAGVAVLSENQNVTIKDSTITATDDFALATNGSKTKNATITVKDSTLTSNGSVGVYLPGDADATFDNATVSGTTAMYIKGGDVDIIGGSYTGTGDHADYSYNGNGCNATGDAIVVENAGSAYPANNVTISDDAALAVTGNGTYALGAYTKNDDDAVEVALDDVTVPSAYGVGEATFSFANGASITNADTPEGYELQDNGNGTATVVYAPLNPLMVAAADINDGNAFEINSDYLKGTLLGVQKKSDVDDAEITSESHQENGSDMRFVAVLDKDLLDDADDYGFVLAKVNTNKTCANTNFDNLKVDMGNGEKTISAKGTYNTVCGTNYGDPESDTPYKYITCAVNSVDDSSKIVARFYYKKDGKTYYAKYAGHNYQYTGCTAGINASGNIY